jgi:hypothetical protein
MFGTRGVNSSFGSFGSFGGFGSSAGLSSFGLGLDFCLSFSLVFGFYSSFDLGSGSCSFFG